MNLTQYQRKKNVKNPCLLQQAVK